MGGIKWVTDSGLSLLFFSRDVKNRETIINTTTVDQPESNQTSNTQGFKSHAVAESSDQISPGVLPTSDQKSFSKRFQDSFARFSLGDKSISMEELNSLELEVHLRIESSPEALELFSAQYRTALAQKDMLVVYSLERAFMSSLPGIAALKEIYENEVEKRTPLDWHALQSLNQLQEFMSREERITLFGNSIEQFNRYSDLNSYGPAMRFMTDAMRNPINGVPTMQRNAAIQLIQQRHSVAKSPDEQFFTAQALYRMLPQSEGVAFAIRNLSANPNSSDIQAVLEATSNKELPKDPILIDSLRMAMTNTEMTAEQIAYARTILGIARPSFGG